MLQQGSLGHSSRKNTGAFALAMVVACVFILVPAFYGVWLSLTNYNAAKGLFNSPWAGLVNYSQVLQDPTYLAAVGASALFALIESAVLFVLSLPLGALLTGIRRTGWLRGGLVTLLLIPLLIPQEIWASLYLNIFSAKATANIALLASWSALKYIGLPALLVSAAMQRNSRNRLLPLAAGGIASLVLFATLGRLDYSFLRMLLPTDAQTIDTYVYRAMMETTGMSNFASIGPIAMLLRLVAVAAVAVPVALLLRGLLPRGAAEEPDDRPKSRRHSLLFSGIAVVVAAAVLLAFALHRGLVADEATIYAGLPLSIGVALLQAAVNTALCFFLAQRFVSAGNRGKRLLGAVLLALTVLSSSAVSMGQYYLFHSMGLLNTIYAVALADVGSVWGVWPLLLAAKEMGIEDNSGWTSRMARPTLGLFAIQAALLMGNVIPSMLYLPQSQLTHPLYVLERLYRTSEFVSQQFAVPNLALMTLATAALPVILLLVARAVLDEKESLALFLPGK